MKTTKSILASLVFILSFTVSAMAQTKPEVIVVVNKANWCHVCEKNGPRAMAAFMANNTDHSFQFVGNDLSNDQTKKSSLEDIKKVGLEKEVANLKYTGVAYFFNAQTKELVNKISIAKSDEKLAAAMVDAKKSVQ